MFHASEKPEFLALLIALIVFLEDSVGGVPARELQIITDSEVTATIGDEPIDLLVSSRSGDKQNDQRLFGTFSAAGRNYETSGDIVQVFPYRACDIKRKGYDRTLIDHIAVVFFDDLEPFITGCVSLDNQVRFAEKSGALGLVVGPESRVVPQIDRTQRGRIPVVMLDDLETKRLKKQLNEATHSGSVIRIAFEYVDLEPHYTLRLQIFRPTVLNIGLIILLILLLLFITGLVYIKIRWRPTSHRDIWLRTLARSAVNKMEIRKFEKSDNLMDARNKIHKKRCFLCFPSRRRYLPAFGSLTSVARSYGGQERCSICLEEYTEGQELRVLFCGHEFHPKCVDPWLLSNRRCPLCQYDVVYKEYPKMEGTTKNYQANSTSIWDLSNRPDVPLLRSPGCNDTTARAATNSYMQIQSDVQNIIDNNNSQNNDNSPDSKKKHRRAVRFKEVYNHHHWLSVNRSPIVCPQHSIGRDTRNRGRDALNLRSSKRCSQSRPRSFSAHQKRQIQRLRRPVIPLNLEDGITHPSTSRNAKHTLDNISGYSSDISSYPELERSDSPETSSRYHTLMESSPSRSPELKVFQQSVNLKRTYPIAPPVETISKSDAASFQRISPEKKHQIL